MASVKHNKTSITLLFLLPSCFTLCLISLQQIWPVGLYNSWPFGYRSLQASALSGFIVVRHQSLSQILSFKLWTFPINFFHNSSNSIIPQPKVFVFLCLVVVDAFCFEMLVTKAMHSLLIMTMPGMNRYTFDLTILNVVLIIVHYHNKCFEDGNILGVFVIGTLDTT